MGIWRNWVWILCVAVLTACGGSSGGGTGNNDAGGGSGGNASATLTATGGTLRTPNQAVTLTLPAGALAADTEIGITSTTPAAPPAGLAVAASALEMAGAVGLSLEPSGTVFPVDKPAHVKIALPAATPLTGGGFHVPVGILSLTSADGTVEAVNNALVQVDQATGETTLEADLPHFSDLEWFPTASQSFGIRVTGVPDELYLGGTFTARVESVSPTPDLHNTEMNVRSTDQSVSPVYLLGGTPLGIEFSSPNGPGRIEYACERTPGDGLFKVEFTFEATGDTITIGDNKLPAAVFVNTTTISKPVRCADPDTTPPVITLSGSNPITLTVDDPFTDPGATASDPEDGDLTGSIVTGGTVNTSAEGTYTLTYDVSDSAGNAATQVTRTVIVEAGALLDTTPPVISLLGANPMTVTAGDSFTDPGATASDDVDGDITGSIVTDGFVDTTTAGTYTITYGVADSSGNLATHVTRTVIVEAAALLDTTPPVISLIGSPRVELTVGDTYVEAGATATDDFDGPLPNDAIAISGTVDTGTPGIYILNYNVSDSSGNAAIEVRRNVVVVAAGLVTTDIALVDPGALVINVIPGGVYDMLVHAHRVWTGQTLLVGDQSGFALAALAWVYTSDAVNRMLLDLSNCPISPELVVGYGLDGIAAMGGALGSEEIVLGTVDLNTNVITWGTPSPAAGFTLVDASGSTSPPARVAPAAGDGTALFNLDIRFSSSLNPLQFTVFDGTNWTPVLNVPGTPLGVMLGFEARPSDSGVGIDVAYWLTDKSVWALHLAPDGTATTPVQLFTTPQSWVYAAKGDGPLTMWAPGATLDSPGVISQIDSAGNWNAIPTPAQSVQPTGLVLLPGGDMLLFTEEYVPLPPPSFDGAQVTKFWRYSGADGTWSAAPTTLNYDTALDLERIDADANANGDVLVCGREMIDNPFDLTAHCYAVHVDDTVTYYGKMSGTEFRLMIGVEVFAMDRNASTFLVTMTGNSTVDSALELRTTVFSEQPVP